MFIVIDGIDGAGKSTLIGGFANYLESKNKKVCFIKKLWAEMGKHPSVDELKDFDVIISAEPTSVGVGSAIREEIIKTGESYTVEDTAEAYALDRLILYNKLIIPLLKAKKMIIQDRSVSTSLCYQPIQSQGVTVDYLTSLHGNALALQNAPEHLILLDVGETQAMTRLSGRYTKHDNAKFEQTDFMHQARDRYMSPEYQKIFTDRGTRIHILKADTPADIMIAEGIILLNSIISL